MYFSARPDFRSCVFQEHAKNVSENRMKITLVNKRFELEGLVYFHFLLLDGMTNFNSNWFS